MAAFAILGLPVFTFLIAGLARSKRISRRIGRNAFAIQFLKGALYCIPCFVAVLLLKRYVFLSFRYFPLYLYYFSIDHLLPLGFLAAAYFSFYSESSFIDLLMFSGGFFSVLGIVEVLLGYGHYEPYLLFVLPTVRIGILLFLPIFFLRFREWYGVVRALFLALLIFVPFLTAAISYLYIRFYVLWACLLVVLFFLGSLLYLFLEREA